MTIKRIVMHNIDDDMMIEFTPMGVKNWYHSEFDALDMNGQKVKMCSDTDNLEGFMNRVIDAGYRIMVVE